MKKDILAKAVRLADKSKARPEKVVISKPVSPAPAKKPVAIMLSERLWTRLTPREAKRLRARIGKMMTISEYIRDLVVRDLDANDRKHGR